MKYVTLIPKVAKWMQVIAESVKFFIDKVQEHGLLPTEKIDEVTQE
jgi:hypothetical protein